MFGKKILLLTCFVCFSTLFSKASLFNLVSIFVSARLITFYSHLTGVKHRFVLKNVTVLMVLLKLWHYYVMIGRWKMQLLIFDNIQIRTVQCVNSVFSLLGLSLDYCLFKCLTERYIYTKFEGYRLVALNQHKN